MIKILLLFIIILLIFYFNKINEDFFNINDNYDNIIKYDSSKFTYNIYPSSNITYLNDNIYPSSNLSINDNILKDIAPSNINLYDNLPFNINNKKIIDNNIITFDNIINSDVVNNSDNLSNDYDIINLNNINTVLKIPKKSKNCYLVTKKYMLNENNIPNFKYEINNLKDDKCNYDLYTLNSNQQLLIDDNIDINSIGSCRYSNKECIDFFNKKECDKYNMIWSSKTCNESLKFKPFQTCEDNYIYNKIDNNCIKCPDTYTYFDGNCINKSYITNDYNIITPSTDDINKDSVICKKQK